MRFRSMTGRAVLVFAVGLRILPGPASADTAQTAAITAFTVKEASPVLGETVTFEVGVTSGDATTWDPSTVNVSIAIQSAGGSVLQTSAPVAPAAPIVPGQTTPVFVKLAIATNAPGTYAAIATVTHAGSPAYVAPSLAIVVGALRAQIPAKNAPKKPFSATLASNESISNPSAQSLSVQTNGKYADGRSFSSKIVLSSLNGGSQPVGSFQTATTIVTGGTYTPSFDNLVLSGVTGTGLSVRRQLVGASTIQVEELSSGHATPNPFTLDGVSLGTPIGAGTLGFTAAIARVEGPPDYSLNSFLEFGDLYGLTYRHPVNDAGFSYELRYGIANYFDGISLTRRVDRAYEALAGFNLLKAAWTVDAIHTGPFYPVVTAPALTADTDNESLTGTRTFGALSAKFRLQGTTNGLVGSPSTQIAHVWNEGLNLGYTFKSNDALEFDTSNAINHVLAETSVESLTQNLAASYTGKRGVTTFEADFGTATDQDNSGVTTHTVTDAVSLGRAVATGLSLTARYALTEILSNAAVTSSISQEGSLKLTYGYRAFALSVGFDRATELPLAGITLPANLGLNAGLAFKPKKTPLTVSSSFTQTHGVKPSSIARLNVSRKY